MRIFCCALLILIPSSAGAQAGPRPAALDSTVTAHLGALTRVRLRDGVVAEFGRNRQRGDVEAVLQGMRADSLVLGHRRNGTSAHVAVGDLRRMEIRVPRTSNEGFARSLRNGAIVGAVLVGGFRLLDNRATGSDGRRLHGTLDGVLTDVFVGAIAIGAPSAFIGAAFPGRTWKRIPLPGEDRP